VGAAGGRRREKAHETTVIRCRGHQRAAARGASGRLPRHRNGQLFENPSIIYAGTLYLERNLSAVLGALASVARERPWHGRAVKLRIAGRIEDPQMEKLRSEIAEHGLSEVVEFCGQVSRAQALELTRRSHLALVLAQGQPTQIPAKLYECVGPGSADARDRGIEQRHESRGATHRRDGRRATRRVRASATAARSGRRAAAADDDSDCPDLVRSTRRTRG
jgi:hypothetical protein